MPEDLRTPMRKQPAAQLEYSADCHSRRTAEAVRLLLLEKEDQQAYSCRKPCRTSQGPTPKPLSHQSKSTKSHESACMSGFIFSHCRPATTRAFATSRPTPCWLASRTRRPGGTRDLQISGAEPEALLAGRCSKATWLIYFVTACPHWASGAERLLWMRFVLDEPLQLVGMVHIVV